MTFDVELEGVLALTQVEEAPAAPASGMVCLYVKDDGKLYGKGSDGVEFEIGGGGGGVETYMDRVKDTESADLIAYFPIAEPSGTTMTDESTNGNDGTYTDVTLGVTGIGDGETAGDFNGSSSIGAFYGSAFNTLFNRDEGTVMVWIKTGSWTNGSTGTFLRIGQAVNDFFISLEKSNTNNKLRVARAADGTKKEWNTGNYSASDWMCVVLTWSLNEDEQILYVDGSQQDSTLTGLVSGVILDPPNPPAPITLASRANVGAHQSGSNHFDGDIAHVAVWTKPLSAAQVADLATV